MARQSPPTGAPLSLRQPRMEDDVGSESVGTAEQQLPHRRTAERCRDRASQV